MNNKTFRERLVEYLNNTAFVMESIVKLAIIAILAFLLYKCAVT